MQCVASTVDSPSAKPVLEVLDSAQAAQSPSCHDAYARTQRFTFLHAVRCQDDCVTCRPTRQLVNQCC